MFERQTTIALFACDSLLSLCSSIFKISIPIASVYIRRFHSHCLAFFLLKLVLLVAANSLPTVVDRPTEGMVHAEVVLMFSSNVFNSDPFKQFESC